MTDAAALYELLRRIRYDATAIQAKLTDAFAMLDALEIRDVERLACPVCGVPMRGPNTLAEHLYASHDGPLPEHWRRVDELVSLADEPAPASDHEASASLVQFESAHDEEASQ